PIGQEIVIRNQTFRVVGVTSSNDEQQIETIFVPYTSLQKLLEMKNVHTITVFAAHAGDSTRIADEIKSILRKRHHLDAESAMARWKAIGMRGNQMPTAGAGFGVADDFTVSTQAAEALTKGLYTSVSAFILANMPKVDQINMTEMAGTLNRAGMTMTALLAAI